MSGPLPTNFRWLWYLVGLAGMALAVVGLLAMIGSIVNDGLLLPVLGIAAIVLGYVLFRYRRRPRRPRQSVDPVDPAISGGAPGPESPANTATAGAVGAADALQRTSPSAPDPAAKKPLSGPPRTSRR
jgi:uncharacterized membrane protein YfcA